MKAWRLNWVWIFSHSWLLSYAFNIGVITTKGNEGLSSLVEHVLKEEGRGDNLNIRILTETVDKEDIVSYHRAFCKLGDQGFVALLSPASELTNSILTGYSFESKIPFITTDVADITSGLSSPFALGIRPSTTRAILGLLQHHRWKDFVYLYDHEYGTENLHMMILLGHRVLKLTVDGILKVDSADQANWYLRTLDRSYSNKVFHVILDTDPSLARDIIWRHVNDVNVRKKNFHFLVSQPMIDHVWTAGRTTFGPVNVTAFTIQPHLQRVESTIQSWIKRSTFKPDVLALYYYDAALVVHRILQLLVANNYKLKTNFSLGRECLQENPSPVINSSLLQKIIGEINIGQGAIGRIQFENGLRTNIELNITEISSLGYKQVGTWADGVLRFGGFSERENPTTLPLIQDRNLLRVATIINPPYMMLKKGANYSSLDGNKRFDGYLKDVLDLIAGILEIRYELYLAEDGQYGKYDKSKGKWSGLIGEVIQGRADLAAADLIISGQRQRVVDFTDPFAMIGFSLVMKNPLSIKVTSSLFFFGSAFSSGVWICILVSIVAFAVLFHVITMFTGAPDSIESASGIWGRKHALILNIWFAAGSSTIRGTGVYPRSIASRMLSGIFWFFTVILCALFIASTASQILSSKQMQTNNPKLIQLKDMSLESVITESVTRGWPSVGLVASSNTATFVKKSTILTYKKFAEYLADNPAASVATAEDGLKRVHESTGGYMVMLDSLKSEYAIRRKPCDIIATHSSVNYAGYGFASRLGSQWTSIINNALTSIRRRGTLADFHRKWWIDTSECKNLNEGTRQGITVHVFSGLLIISLIGFLIISMSFSLQYIRKHKNKENRRQQLSFEDMNLSQPFPAPPPELLAEPAPVLNLPEYDRKTLL